MTKSKQGIFHFEQYLIASALGVLILCSARASNSSTAPRIANKEELQIFLKKLKDVNEREENLSFYNEKGPSEFESGLHALWFADVNNDGRMDSFWTTEAAGSGHYDSFDAYNENKVGKLKALRFPLDGSKVPSNMCQPPLKFENEKTLICFKDFHSVDSKGKRTGTGGTSNASIGASKLIEKQLDYLWENTKGKFIRKSQTQSDLKP